MCLKFTKMSFFQCLLICIASVKGKLHYVLRLITENTMPKLGKKKNALTTGRKKEIKSPSEDRVFTCLNNEKCSEKNIG